jgi:hypothetical protein
MPHGHALPWGDGYLKPWDGLDVFVPSTWFIDSYLIIDDIHSAHDFP